jgi:hypothetical protein
MLLPDLINTAKLSLKARNAGSSLLQCVFLARELILQDNFSRLCPPEVMRKLADAHDMFISYLSALRYDECTRMFLSNIDAVHPALGCDRN